MNLLKNIFYMSGGIAMLSRLHAVVVESKPILPVHEYDHALYVQQREQLNEQSSQMNLLESKVDQLLEYSEQLVHKHEFLKGKIDSLEKQQRDFLALMSDIVLQPEYSVAPQEHKDYQTALDLMKAQQYSQALKGLQKFIHDYPQSEKIPYVYYWIAELYLMDNQYEQAGECYSYLLTNYPLHHKASEALFKIGQISYNIGRTEEAKLKWLEVIQRFPQSQASQLAKKNLPKVDKDYKPHAL
jgi:tol-pal system protein YbgF